MTEDRRTKENQIIDGFNDRLKEAFSNIYAYLKQDCSIYADLDEKLEILGREFDRMPHAALHRECVKKLKAMVAEEKSNLKIQ